jgi:DNA-binding IclR family transcriptional regulator
MRALARELGEATHLTVLHGITVTVVGSVASRRAARSTTFIGTTFPAHFSASGQALLADLSLEELRRRYSNAALHQTAWRRTKVIRASDDALWNTLLAELDRTRTLGFATNFRSGNRGVNAIACSLKLGTNVAPFALVIDAPRTQTGRRRLLSYAKPLLDAATHIRHRFLPAPGRAVDQ